MKQHSKTNLTSKELLLLKRHLKTFDELTDDQLIQIVAAIKHSSLENLSVYKDREIKYTFWLGLKFLPKARYDNFILWIRGIFFKLAKKQAALRANTEGYHMYVVRDSLVRFKIFSTLEFNLDKKLKVYKKEVDSIYVKSIAAFTAKPKPGVLGEGFSGQDIKDTIKASKPNTNKQSKKKRNKK